MKVANYVELVDEPQQKQHTTSLPTPAPVQPEPEPAPVQPEAPSRGICARALYDYQAGIFFYTYLICTFGHGFKNTGIQGYFCQIYLFRLLYCNQLCVLY